MNVEGKNNIIINDTNINFLPLSLKVLSIQVSQVTNITIDSVN